MAVFGGIVLIGLFNQLSCPFACRMRMDRMAQNEGHTVIATPLFATRLDANIFSLTADDSDQLWAATSKGVYKVDLKNEQHRLMDTRQKDAVYSVIRRDRYLLSSSWDKRIVAFEPSTGNIVKESIIKCETGVTRSVLTGDGKWLVTCTSDTPGSGVVIKADSFQHERDITAGNVALSSIAASPIGDTIAIGDRAGMIRQYRISDGKCLATSALNKDTSVDALMYSPDAKILAVGSSNGTVNLIHSSGKGEMLTSRHRGGVNSVCFSPSGSSLLVGFGDDGMNSTKADNYFSCWNLEQLTRANFAIPFDGLVQYFLFTHDFKQVAVATSRGAIIVYSGADITK